MTTAVRILFGVSVLSVLVAMTPATALEPGQYPVGYRCLEKLDHSRSFGEAAPPWRPVQIHVWYPSVAQAGSGPMRYGDYVRAAVGVGEITGDRNDEDAAQALLDQWRGSPQRRGADAQSVDEYLERTVLAVSEAEPAPGPFPLILYAASWNANPYENAELFEYLASHGYVVAGVPSMGSDEVAMALNVEGAAAQRDDLAFALATLAIEPSIDSARIGAAGFSWGGLTSLLLTLQHRGVSAVVCLDGACRMENYRDIAEAFPAWSAQRMRAALFDIVLADEPRWAGLTADIRYADVYLWTQPGLLHLDFASDGIARFRRLPDDENLAHSERFHDALSHRIRLFFDLELKGDEGARAPMEQAPDVDGAVWTTRRGHEPPPTQAEIIRIAEEEGADACVSLVYELLAADPGLVLLDEGRLLALGQLWGPQRAADFEKLLHLNLELYPRSAETYFWLAQVELANGNQTQAREMLSEALDCDADHERARRLLDRLGP